MVRFLYIAKSIGIGIAFGVVAYILSGSDSAVVGGLLLMYAEYRWGKAQEKK